MSQISIAENFIPKKFTVCNYSSIVQKMYIIQNRNADGTNKLPPCFHVKHWYQRFHLGGEANIDGSIGNRAINKYSSYQPWYRSWYGSNYYYPYQKNTYTDLQINALDIYADAALLPWVTAHVTLNYHTLEQRFPIPSVNQFLGTPDGARRVNIEEAYVTIGNIEKFPLYLRLGKQYLNFGDYVIHPIVQSLTQLLTQTNQIAATLGFVIPQGYYGSVFWFQGGPKLNKFNHVVTRNNQVFGGQLGWRKINYDMGYNINIGYLSNITDAMYTQFLLTRRNRRSGFHKRVGGININAAINTGPFTYKADFVVALQRFSPFDVIYGHPYIDYYNYPYQHYPYVKKYRGARPWAVGVESQYAFEVWHRHAHFSVGYQRSNEASFLHFPRWRVFGGFHIAKILPDTNLGVLALYDKDYTVKNGGTGRNIVVGYVRINVAIP